MAVTVETFLVGFPEFRQAPSALIAKKLADAQLQVDSAIWGEKTDTGVELLTAHLLAMSPFGQNVRMTIPGTRNGRTEPTTTYWTFFSKMMRQVTSGFRVT